MVRPSRIPSVSHELFYPQKRRAFISSESETRRSTVYKTRLIESANEARGVIYFRRRWARRLSPIIIPLRATNLPSDNDVTDYPIHARARARASSRSLVRLERRKISGIASISSHFLHPALAGMGTPLSFSREYYSVLVLCSRSSSLTGHNFILDLADVNWRIVP